MEDKLRWRSAKEIFCEAIEWGETYYVDRDAIKQHFCEMVKLKLIVGKDIDEYADFSKAILRDYKEWRNKESLRTI